AAGWRSPWRRWRNDGSDLGERTANRQSMTFTAVLVLVAMVSFLSGRCGSGPPPSANAALQGGQGAGLRVPYRSRPIRPGPGDPAPVIFGPRSRRAGAAGGRASCFRVARGGASAGRGPPSHFPRAGKGFLTPAAVPRVAPVAGPPRDGVGNFFDDASFSEA